MHSIGELLNPVGPTLSTIPEYLTANAAATATTGRKGSTRNMI